MIELILASTSPYRLAVLRRAGLDPVPVAPGLDEQPYKDKQMTSPRDLALELARAKAMVVSARYPDAVVIAGDQVAATEGRRFDKAGTPERAVEQLMLLQGRPHQLWTAICVCASGGKAEQSELHCTTLHMRTLTREIAEAYVGLDKPWDCAGSYRIESRGVVLFDEIDGDSPGAIEGVPLLLTLRLLRRFGIDPLELTL
jgi:septum formation protein